MDTQETLALVVDDGAAFVDRLAAIESLRQIRLREVTTGGKMGRPIHLAGLPGKSELSKVMGQDRGPLELRCQAAAALAETDAGAALDVCIELL
jgi:hypothetical protein